MSKPSGDEASIYDLEQEIRRYFTSARRFRVLNKDRHTSARVMSALDVLGDTECAFDSYLTESLPHDKGLTYVIIFGVMQLLVVQQDAVNALWEYEFGETLVWSQLPSNRALRNQFVGHPVADKSEKLKKHGKREKRSGFIARGLMSPYGFSAMTLGADGRVEHRIINLRDEVATQRRELSALLKRIVERQRAKEDVHMASFRDQKLANVWNGADFIVQKLFEAIDDLSSGTGPASLLHEMADELEAQLEARSELFPQGQEEIRILQYALSHLKRYYVSSGASLTSDDAYIYCSFAEQQVEKLKALCAEVDDRYAGREHSEPTVSADELPVVAFHAELNSET